MSPAAELQTLPAAQELESIQRRFQHAVLNEDLAPDLFEAEGAEVAGGFALYLAAYRARLIEALRDNFPVLHRALGDEDFDELASAYIALHPSRFRSIRWFGDALVAFLDADPQRLPHPALADVARMDWAMRGAFDAEGATPLTANELLALAPEQWLERRLILLPSLRLVAMDWEVEALWQALNEDADAQTEAPAPRAHGLLVWRPALACQWRSVSDEERALLEACRQGLSFAELCAAAAERHGEQAAATVAGYLRLWVDAGLLAAFE